MEINDDNDYGWIRELETIILDEWMKTGVTDTYAKRKEFDNINNWCVYEDHYGKDSQSCFICVRDMRIAKGMQKRLEKKINELDLTDCFWCDYGRANEDYANAPIVIIGIEEGTVERRKDKLIQYYTLKKLEGKI